MTSAMANQNDSMEYAEGFEDAVHLTRLAAIAVVRRRIEQDITDDPIRLSLLHSLADELLAIVVEHPEHRRAGQHI